MNTIEQVDFVIDALSKSTNSEHATERAEVLVGLRAVREIAMLTASPDGLMPLPEGGTRFVFSAKEWLHELKANAAKWDDSSWRIQRAADGRLVVDVLPLTPPTERAA
jgi:hypothetical protein